MIVDMRGELMFTKYHKNNNKLKPCGPNIAVAATAPMKPKDDNFVTLAIWYNSYHYIQAEEK